MSADNGIYIGQFSDGFRVIHAQAIDNVNYFPENSVDEAKEIVLYFGDGKLFSTEKEALLYAGEFSKKFDILEYGICLIPFPQSFEHYKQKSL